MRNRTLPIRQKNLFISQPAISDRLKRLEAEFGCQLFIRQPRGILFTSQGRCWSNTSTKRMNAIKKSAAPLQNPWGKSLWFPFHRLLQRICQVPHAKPFERVQEKVPLPSTSPSKAALVRTVTRIFSKADSMSASFAANTIGQSTKKAAP